MCMITTAARLDDEASEGSTNAACAALRGSSRETSENEANDSEESARSLSLLPAPQVEGLARDRAAAEKRRGTTVFAALSGVSPTKKQRIEVIVRIRPIEDRASRTTTVLADDRTLRLAAASKGAKKELDQGRFRESRKELEVTFDRVLGESAEQKEVYDQVKACVRLPFSGVNSCIFAYGQTGSGKTYSMMGDIPQLGAGRTSTTTNNDSLPTSSSITHLENSGKCEAVDGDGIERLAVGKNSKAGQFGTEVAGDAAGVIPRAVDDIFRIVRQGGVRQDIVTTPLPSASDRRSFGEPPPEESKPPSAEAGASPSAACGSDCTSAPDTSAPGTSQSSRSSGSNGSEDSSLTQVPSAAHWPLSEPIVYVPRAQASKESSLPLARQRAQPYDDPEKCDTVGREARGGSDGKPRACQQEHGVTAVTACKYSVQCSYLQVYNGRVYDLLSPHASQHRPLPVFTPATQGTLKCFGVEGREENADGNISDASSSVAGNCRFRSFSRRESCSGSRLVGLSAHVVDNPEQVMELLRQGVRNRRVRSTQMNTHSSRSHTIVQFTISRTTGEATAAALDPTSGCETTGTASNSAPIATRQRRRQHHHRGDDDDDNTADDEQPVGETFGDHEIVHDASTNVSSRRRNNSVSAVVTTRAKLSLVDLAGSEKGRVGGERGTEKGESPSQAQAGSPPSQGEDSRDAREWERSRINSSLSALSNCISCLGDARRTHVPFRDNPLTRLLQDSLVGGKTVVIATIRPSVDAQAESLSTLNFAARCMRVVARQRVNEVVSDSLLLERARRQISALRRRLVEAEAAAAAIASSPAPSQLPLSWEEKVNPLPAPAEPPPRHPPLPTTETKAVVLATPDARIVCSGGNGNNGSSTVGRGEAARSGDGRRCAKYASLMGVPRGERSQEQPAEEKPIGNNSDVTRASEDETALKLEASVRTRCAKTANQAAAPVSKSEARSPLQRPVRADERARGSEVHNDQPRQLSSPSLSGGRERKMEGGVKIRTLLNEQRGRDIVVRGKIATAVAAANAAAAAATAVASAISAAGGGRSRHALANRNATQSTFSDAVVHHRSSGGPVRSQLRMAGDGLRATKARKPTFRSSGSTTSGRPALPARGASSPAAASAIGVAEAGGQHSDESNVATQALIERFSSREEELLRELEAWKSRCKSLEKKETPQRRSTDDGCSLASQIGGGRIGERRVGEKPTRLEATPNKTLAVPPEPVPAEPQRPLHATSEASPSTGTPEEEALDASKPSADSQRLALGGAGKVSTKKTIVPQQGRNVDPPRRTSIEVLQQCAGGWWYRRLPNVPRATCREEPDSNPLKGERTWKPGENNPRAVDGNRMVIRAAEVAVVAERAGQGGRQEKHGTDKPRGTPAAREADLERSTSRQDEDAVGVVGGENQGQSKAPTPFAVESQAQPPQDEAAETTQESEHPPPQSVKAEDKTSHDGDDGGAHGNDGTSRPAESVLPRPRVVGAAVAPARTRRSIRDGTALNPRSPQGNPAQPGESETHRNGIAEQDTTVGGAHVGIRPSAVEAVEVAPTPSLPVPLSPGSVWDNSFVQLTKIDGKGCQRHGLAPCSLCGDSSSLRSSDDHSSASPRAERAQGDPCDRHLLLDCILCKMLSPALKSPVSFGRTKPHQHVLGRSTSLPALGSTTTGRDGGHGISGGNSGGGAHMTRVPATATNTAFGSPSTYRCDRHDLHGCLLCGSRVKSPTAPRGDDAADSRRADDGPALSSALQLVLPSPTSHGGGLYVGGVSAADAFMDQRLRSKRGAAIGSGSATSEISSVLGGGEGGHDAAPNKEDRELFGRSILFRAPHLAGVQSEISDGAVVPPKAKVCDEPLGSDVAEYAGFCGVGRRPSGNELTTSRGGFQRKATSSEATEIQYLAGGGSIRLRESSDGTYHAGHVGRSTNAARARVTPGRRCVDAAGDAVRHRRQRRSRGGTPHRRRNPSKPSKANFVGHDPFSSRSVRNLQGSKNSEHKGVAGGRAQANTAVSATRAREKLGDDDLAARAMTAALAVLQ